LVMDHAEAVSFIQKAIISEKAQRWADLGCGSGTFTKALAALLPPGSHITAIDRDRQHFDLPQIEFVRADIEQELALSGLDGILIANALHYVKDKAALITKLQPMFGDSFRFVIIEYDTEQPNAWVPFPITFERLRVLFERLGYRRIIKLAERPSVYRSSGMYCALIES
jgi:ubiquinone/menaquinone biosynthesis C-methylase UbiE